MQTPLKSMEQLMPFATAGELAAKNTKAVVSVTPDSTVFVAMERMAQMEIGLVVVLEGDHLAGVLSERDCARAVVLRSFDPRTTPVRELMTTRVYTVAPETPTPECVKLMHEKGIRHLPVAVAGRVQGVLSVRDFMGSLIERHERLLRRFQEERMTLLFPDPNSY